jgi:hypothetical protein
MPQVHQQLSALVGNYYGAFELHPINVLLGLNLNSKPAKAWL